MYNELKIKMLGKVGLDLTLEEQHALLVELEERIGSLLEAYGVKDIKYDIVGDIVNVQEGDTCPECGGKLYFKKGIEIGNLFKLGTKYAEKLGLTYLGYSFSFKSGLTSKCDTGKLKKHPLFSGFTLSLNFSTSSRIWALFLNISRTLLCL